MKTKHYILIAIALFIIIIVIAPYHDWKEYKRIIIYQNYGENTMPNRYIPAMIDPDHCNYLTYASSWWYMKITKKGKLEEKNFSNTAV